MSKGHFGDETMTDKLNELFVSVFTAGDTGETLTYTQ